jgi:hypothetical protein
MTRNVVLAQAVKDLAALLDYAGKVKEASTLRAEIPDLSSGRTRGLEALQHLNSIRSGILALRQAELPTEAKPAADAVVARINRVLSQN